MKDVTGQEVRDAAAESTLAAVQCSMRHWLYNTNSEEGTQAIGDGKCALCRRCQWPRQHNLPEGGICPLHDDGYVCCKEYIDANNAKNHTLFKQAANALYVRLAKIEYDLMHKDDKKEEKGKELPSLSLVKGGENRLLVATDVSEGLSSTVMIFGTDGRFTRVGCVNTCLGLDLDERGRIVEKR